MLRGLFFIVEREEHYIQAYSTLEKPQVKEIMFLSVRDVDLCGARLGQ